MKIFVRASWLGLLIIAPAVWAIPSTINYQGALKDKGAPANGTRQMSFRITNEDGTQVYWASANQLVAVSNGLFSARVQPVGVKWETLTPFLEVSVEGQQLLPREPIHTTVYAQVARDVESGAIDPANIASGYGLVPAGMVAMFDAACPPGWKSYAALNNRFPMGSDVAGTTGGSAKHSHVIASGGSHDHGGYTGIPPASQFDASDAGANFGAIKRAHSHPIATDGVHDHGGITGETNTLPPYTTVLYCQKQ